MSPGITGSVELAPPPAKTPDPNPEEARPELKAWGFEAKSLRRSVCQFIVLPKPLS